MTRMGIRRYPRHHGPQPPKISPEEIIHTKFGLWDVYQKRFRPSPRLSWSKYVAAWGSRLNPIKKNIMEDMPYLLDMLHEVYLLARLQWIAFLALHLIDALTPATSLYFSGQLLVVLNSAIELRQVDSNALIYAAIGTAACTYANKISKRYSTTIRLKLTALVADHFDERVIYASARLDLPTSEDSGVQTTMRQNGIGGGTPMAVTSSLIGTVSIIIQLLTQVLMLIRLLRDQKESMSLILWSFTGPTFRWIKSQQEQSSWVSIMESEDYHRKRTIPDIVYLGTAHRKEIVVGNMADYLSQSYRESKDRLGVMISTDEFKGKPPTSQQDIFGAATINLFQDAIAQGPKVAFAWRALHTPSSIPLSLATLTVVQQQVNAFTRVLFQFLQTNDSLALQIASVKDLYELDKIPNQVKDGIEPFPETEKRGQGVSLEFKDVSFRYPTMKQDALTHVSFRIKAGDLCVIVGANGQGKSSILKLLTRLYDPSSGTIYADDKPIESFKLEDLRNATSVLFQDFTIFPSFTAEENIGMGDPSSKSNEALHVYEERVKTAADMGGATEFLSKLHDGIKSQINSQPPNTRMGGRDKIALREAVSIMRKKAQGDSSESSLSGGQKQRLALARTFMRRPEAVSILLYDEPSASLDPQAEYDLFQRLRALRKNKTMVFSTHRFGYLTKHADIILFMKDSTIAESGTHDELMELDGGYSHLYRLQAQAFL